ncbi:MAG: dihydropteroate synthase [Henriciella sp.]
MITPHVMETLRDQLLEAARKRVLLMGILNVTPDSFSDGGQHEGLEAALAHAGQMQAEGADIIDVGGESTRPGAEPVSAEEELARVIEVIEALAGVGKLPVSIDTYKASVAREACRSGAVIINDVSGLADPEMAHVAAETGAALVVTYNSGETDAMTETASDMAAFFEEAFRKCDEAGVPGDRLILDPGVGFAKTYEQNFTVLGHVSNITQFGCPVLVGVSRKSFIGRLLGGETDERLIGTLAAGLNAMKRGANILRVHDVAAHKQSITMWEAIDYAAD